MSFDDYRPPYPSYPGYSGKPHGHYPGYYPGKYPYPYPYPYPSQPSFNKWLPLFLLLPFLNRGERDNEIGKDFATHTIQEGEDLMDVAKKYNIPLQILLLANPDLQHPLGIQPGTVVHIPQLWDWSCHPMFMNEDHAHFMMPQPGSSQGGMMNPMGGFPQYPYPPAYPMQRDFGFAFDEEEND
jgi:LysM repeat protein